MRTEPDHLALHRHRVPGFGHYPFVCVLQTPESGGRQRIVCPVSTTDEVGPTLPRLVIGAREHVLILRLMLAMPLAALGEAVGSAESIRPDIGRGIDRIFFGI